MNKLPPQRIAFLIGDVSRLFRQRFEAAIAAAGLEVTVGESRTLFHAAQEDGIRQAQLAQRMGIEPMTLVNFLDRLEARGWIARSTDPADRRAKIVRVTPEAEPLVARLEEIAREVRRGAAAGIPDREMEIVRAALERMRRNLAAQGERAAA